jgi:hypothetical protein
VASKHLGNSCILVLKPQMEHPYPAQIKHILGLRSTVEMVIAVQRYKPTTVASDPFIRYPALQAKLWSQELVSELEIITPDDIHSHFAACEMVWEGYPVTAVISLFRVSDYFVLGSTELRTCCRDCNAIQICVPCSCIFNIYWLCDESTVV